MKRLCISILGVAGLILSANAGTALAVPSRDSADTTAAGSAVANKVTICHATRTRTHPYVKIQVDSSVLDEHKSHTDRKDITPVPKGGCPPDLKFPEEPTGTGDFVPCVADTNVTQTRTTVTGTSANDTIDCTLASPRKWIRGFSGNDTITGTGSNDTIIGGKGTDTLTGGPRRDFLAGSNGNDTVTGSGGADTLLAGRANDTLNGGVGDDTLLARPSDGGAGAGTGADTLNGDANADTCSFFLADGDTAFSCEM